jgi:predicted TIM-barrel enzyme
MTAAGADIIVAHMGVTTGGAIGAKAAKTLDQCVTEIDAIADAARAVRNDVIILCHGGPIAMPDDARFILARSPHCHGFYGASSMERLPVETAIKAQVEGFKSLPLKS